METIVPYKEEFKKYIPEQYKNSEKLLALVNSCMAQFDDLETAFFEILQALPVTPIGIVIVANFFLSPSPEIRPIFIRSLFLAFLQPVMLYKVLLVVFFVVFSAILNSPFIINFSLLF